MENIENLYVDGFIFANKEDAELAKSEIRKIEYLESHADMTNVAIVKSVYEKAVADRIFQTPIGLEYLRDLQKIMESAGVPVKEEKPIPLFTTFKRMSLKKDNEAPRRRQTLQEKKEMSLRMKYRNAVLAAIILGILVAAMFIVTLNGTTPNAINYKNAVLNQYAEWEQELSDREKAVREKERELNIVP